LPAAEIYSDIVFEGAALCAAAFERDGGADPRLLAVVSGVSKGSCCTDRYTCILLICIWPVSDYLLMTVALHKMDIYISWYM
jgi:hypothetical protein